MLFKRKEEEGEIIGEAKVIDGSEEITDVHGASIEATAEEPELVDQAPFLLSQPIPKHRVPSIPGDRQQGLRVPTRDVVLGSALTLAAQALADCLDPLVPVDGVQLAFHERA